MIKKIFFFSNLLIFISINGFSLDWSDINLSAGISTDYYTGKIHEIVYPGPGWANNYLSELIWEIDNIIMLTGHFSASLNNFSLNISGSTAVNKGTGQMDDYDWGDSTTTTWTNWSNSNIYLDKSFILNTSLTYTIKPDPKVSIPFSIGYKLNYLNWSDKGYKFIYLWNFTTNDYYDTVLAGDWGGTPGINYTFAQNILFITSGIQYAVSNFIGNINGSFSPYVYAWDLDHHLRNKQDGTGTFYLDTFTAHIWYSLEASLSYSLKNSGALKLAVHFEKLPVVIGNVNIYNEDPADSTKVGSPAGYFPNGAGLASKILTISIGYIYHF